MPVTVTTTTTTDDSGAVRTATVTESAPAEAAAASVPTFSDGNIGALFHATFDSKEAAESYDAAVRTICAACSLNNDSHTWVYKIDETTRGGVITWSAEGFKNNEAAFGANGIVQSLQPHMTASVHVVGEPTAEIRKTFGVWNAFPNWTVSYDLETPQIITMGKVAADAVGFHGTYEFESPAALQTYLKFHRSTYASHGNRASNWLTYRVNETTVEIAGIFKSAAHLGDHMKIDLAHPTNQAMMKQVMSSMKPVRAFSFGYNDAPEAEQSRMVWPFLKAAELTTSPRGTESERLLMGQIAFFLTTEERDAVLTELEKPETYGGLNPTFAAIKYGATGMMIVIGADNFAKFQETEGAFQKSPGIMAAWTKLQSCTMYGGGYTGAKWEQDMAGWQAAYPCLNVMAPPSALTSLGGSLEATPGAPAFGYIGFFDFQNEADLTTWKGWAEETEISTAMAKSNTSMAFFKTGPTSVFHVGVSKTMQDWADVNKLWAPKAEAMGSMMKSVRVWYFGNSCEDGEAMMAGWNQAPWCEVHKVDKFYGKI